MPNVIITLSKWQLKLVKCWPGFHSLWLHMPIYVIRQVVSIHRGLGWASSNQATIGWSSSTSWDERKGFVIPPNSDTFSDWRKTRHMLLVKTHMVKTPLGKQQLELSTRTWSVSAPWNCSKFVYQPSSSKWFFLQFFLIFELGGITKHLRYQCTPNDHHSLAPCYGQTFDANPSKVYIFWKLNKYRLRRYIY